MLEPLLKTTAGSAPPLPEAPVNCVGFPLPFEGTLEYNAPARGPWNIVHTGMLLPESHQVYACAQGCLRGVILTAAEMQSMERMSWISVSEEDMFNGELEENLIDGTAEILERMPVHPRAVLLYVSCIHLFAGCDCRRVVQELHRRFPHIDFADCYMNPTMRKSGLTPDQLTRRQLFTLVPERPVNPQAVNIIGNDRPTDSRCEMMQLLAQAGCTVRDITTCRSYDDFLEMGEAALNITTFLPAVAASEALSRRLGRTTLHLPLCYGAQEIERHFARLADALRTEAPDLAPWRQRAENALQDAKALIGDRPIAIDYTATPRPLGLANLLLEHGFNVERIYADAFIPEEAEDFQRLRCSFPAVRISPTVNPAMLNASPPHPDVHSIAIGQKAAWFKNTRHFVNILSGGGLHGFHGIVRLAQLLADACLNPKDTPELIQLKGSGCRSCINM